MICALSASACRLIISTWLTSSAIRCCTYVRLDVGRGDQRGGARLDLADLHRDAVRVLVAAHAIELAALGDDRQAVGVVADVAAERRGRQEDRRRVVGPDHPDPRRVEDQRPRRARARPRAGPRIRSSRGSARPARRRSRAAAAP